MTDVSPFGLAPEEAIRWFRQKGLAPRFDWRDLYAAQHAKAFTVAKATQLDVLADLYQGVSDAIAKGHSLGEFKKTLRPLLQQKGWWGEEEMADPTTGEIRTVQLGSARRLQIIYDTNLRTAHAAAQWDRIKRTSQTRPWLRYVAIEKDGRTRQAHLNWHNTILPFDHPWWKTHYPPNGWGCRCKVLQLSDRDLQRYGFTPSKDAPETRYKVWKDDRNGITRKVPVGIDPGFDYNVGEARNADWNPSKERAADDVRTYRDYGRPAASRITEKATPVASWEPLHDGEDTSRARDDWKALFGADEATVSDPTGDQATFTQRYFDHLLEKRATGDRRRATMVPLAKQTIERPYEIWLVPFRMQDGTIQLRKRYIQIYDGSEGGHLVVVDRQSDGYVTWTSYAKRDIDKAREGYLLYPQ